MTNTYLGPGVETMTDDHRETYFGEPWDAPFIDDATQVATPLGMRCTHCVEMIQTGDQGIMHVVVRDAGGGVPAAGREPTHRECFMRSIMGSVAHLEGRCTCFGGDADDRLTDPGTWREQGRAVLTWLELRRQATDE